MRLELAAGTEVLTSDPFFTAVLEENLPVNKKYPTARAAKTSPMVINLSHLGSSMAAILPQTYN